MVSLPEGQMYRTVLLITYNGGGEDRDLSGDMQASPEDVYWAKCQWARNGEQIRSRDDPM